MLQLGLYAEDCCKAIHVQLAMMQSMLHAYNASNQMVISIKSMFVESLNARKVMQVGMVNPFPFNSTETQGFPSVKPPTPFCGTRPAIQDHSSCQTHAKGAFDMLTHHKTKQL